LIPDEGGFFLDGLDGQAIHPPPKDLLLAEGMIFGVLTVGATGV
jgi:hypothetical protein